MKRSSGRQGSEEYHCFWGQLLQRDTLQMTERHREVIAPSNDTLTRGTGIAGVNVCLYVRRNDADVELYIDKGVGRAEENKAIFDNLYAMKSKIEASFGDKLDWRRLDGERACRIVRNVDIGGIQDQHNWALLQQIMIDTAKRLVKALKPHLSGLR